MQSLTAFLLATVMALALTPAPQSRKQSPQESKPGKIDWCGTEIAPERLKAELARIAGLARTGRAAQTEVPPTNNPYTLPVTIHLVLPEDHFWDPVPTERLNVIIQNLNWYWAQAGIQFFVQAVNSIKNNDFLSPEPGTTKLNRIMRTHNVPNTINVYFTNLYDKGGHGTFPWGTEQGVFVDYNYGVFREDSDPTVLAHEMGHFFSLLHTHQTGADSNGNPIVECPSGINCETTGDGLCDTAADPGLLNGTYRVDANCVYDNSAGVPASCDSTPYDPPVRNLMSYSRPSCKDQFTPGQISRILQSLHHYDNRKNLIISGARYVDPVASNLNNKCTRTAPCRTLAKAVQSALPGDYVFLKPGAYKTSSLDGKHLTLRRWVGAGVVKIAL